MPTTSLFEAINQHIIFLLTIIKLVFEGGFSNRPPAANVLIIGSRCDGHKRDIAKFGLLTVVIVYETRLLTFA